jgi:hypothetical protein
MKEYINKWGTVPWVPSRAEEVHLEDRESVDQLTFWDKVLKCIGITDDGYLILQYSSDLYRVRPKLFATVPSPMFDFGQRVKDTVLNRNGTILHILWHGNRKEEYYILAINGRKSSRRYFANDLELIEETSKE